jgi:Trypsin-like peptidase domain
LKILIFLAFSFNLLAIDKLIYGEDNRKEAEAYSDIYLKSLSRSVSAMIPLENLKKTPTGFKISKKVKSLKDSYGFCEGESFLDQPTAAICTGFLVAPKIMVTAGHCYTEEKKACQKNVWVFDYKSSQSAEFPNENIYRCKKVLKRTFENAGVDFTIVELDREVTDRKPLNLSAQRPAEGIPLVIMGHPMGLPLKIADGAEVLAIKDTFFQANLDSFEGNSGSPVFNRGNGEVEGILVRGNPDYVRDGHCKRANRCDDDGQNCEQKGTLLAEEVVTVDNFSAILSEI